MLSWFFIWVSHLLLLQSERFLVLRLAEKHAIIYVETSLVIFGNLGKGRLVRRRG